MDLNRREFVTVPAAALTGTLFGSVTDTPWQSGSVADAPWQRKIRRLGQLNMTEHDPVALDVEAWADYWASLKVDAIMVSVTGILAFYQTKVPFHRKGKYLGDRDFFGDCCSAAKKRGLRVIARMSPDLNWADALAAHPEWFQRDAGGKEMALTEDPRLFRTCMFTSYMTDYMPAIMREINSLYDVDALFTNAWPPLGHLPVCHCAACQKLPAAGTIEFWEKFNDRTVYLWKLYDAIAKEKRPGNFYFANLGGGIRSSANLVQLGELCEWFQADNQGRGGEASPIWGCAQQGRVCSAVQNGKTATNVTGAWSTGPVRWRNVNKSLAEARMWMNETVASGMVPYHHIISGETGLGEDRRSLAPARKFFRWTAQHDPHFINKRSIANVGVVMGQRTQLFYKPPAGASAADSMDGLYYALLEGRFLFDFVHEDKLALENLKKYSALVLPNTALLSDAQCAQLRAYVESGGSLLATFETSLYTERNQPRADFGLGDLFGIHKDGAIIGTNGNAYAARIERKHPILDGLAELETHLLAGAEYRLPVRGGDAPILTVVPGFVAYPPELAYPEPAHTKEPAVVVRESGRSRMVYFPGDVERTLWRSGSTDLSRMLQNAIRWVSGGKQQVTVDGDGLVELFAWETQAGYAVHVLNYTNPAVHRGLIRKFYAVGAQRVTMQLPPGRRVTRLELLCAGTEIPFQAKDNTISFVIPKVVDYEVAALSVA
jgi:hypothetical protein